MICPEEAELIAYAVGQLQGSAVADVAAHLRQCRTCRKRVHEEMKNESLLIKLRDRPEPGAEGEPVKAPGRDRTSGTTPHAGRDGGAQGGGLVRGVGAVPGQPV